MECQAAAEVAKDASSERDALTFVRRPIARNSENCAASRWRGGSQFKNNYFVEMRSGSEEGSYLRLIDLCITQF